MKEIQYCSIGCFIKTDCSLQPYGKYNVEKNLLHLSNINQVDAIPLVRSLGPSINESWLIRQRLGFFCQSIGNIWNWMETTNYM